MMAVVSEAVSSRDRRVVRDFVRSREPKEIIQFIQGASGGDPSGATMDAAGEVDGTVWGLATGCDELASREEMGYAILALLRQGKITIDDLIE